MSQLNLQINHQTRPILKALQSISWNADALQAKPLAGGQLTISELPAGKSVLTAELTATETSYHDFGALALQPEAHYQVNLKLHSQQHTISETADFYTAADWSLAQWLTCPSDTADNEGEYLFSKGLSLTKPIASAQLYMSACGLYTAYLNDQKIGRDELTPGWTSYTHALQYQVYDVTQALQQTPACQLNVRVGNGWYLGMLTWDKVRMYGKNKALIGQLLITYTDGSKQRIVTDSSWQSAEGPIRLSELYDGETVDCTQENFNFLKTAQRNWPQAQILNLDKKQLTEQRDAPCQVTETVAPVGLFKTPNGQLTLDFGQNLVGRLRVDLTKLCTSEPVKLTFHHSEIMDATGNAYFGNLRKAKQTLTIDHATADAGSIAMHFSFQGFRYVTLEADRPFEFDLNAFSAEVIHTPMARSGYFQCDDVLLNQLYHNIIWGQRGNFVDVPTDCPQRDERLGWTGDTQVFISTGLYNYDGYAFYQKWLQDLASDQLANGGVPAVIPDVIMPLQPNTNSSAAWGDAAVICPWTLYKFYGDQQILKDQYASMKAWIQFNSDAGETPYSGNPGFHYGDWLALDVENSSFGGTPHLYLACCFHRYTTELMRQIAEVLGKTADAKAFAQLRDGIDAHFQKTYLKDDQLNVQTQTAQVLALKMIGLTAMQRQKIAATLNSMVINRNMHLSTGFVGTPYLLETLADNGYPETAMALLHQKEYPSWLYSVTKGATTIWEHWDGIKQDGSLWGDGMNSFNHYAYGAVGNWMYREVLGIDQTPDSVGFSHVLIAPRIKESKLGQVNGGYHSVKGNIECAWSKVNHTVTLRVHVPSGSKATVMLRNAQAESLKLTDPAAAAFDYQPKQTAYVGHLSRNQTLSCTYQLV